MKYQHFTNPEFAIDYLATHLMDGTLVLFLGAGASRGFGLPGWVDFANAFREKVGLPRELVVGDPSDKIQLSMDDALREIGNKDEEKIRIVREILYPSVETLDLRLAFSQELLISICSLLVGRRRGHINRVVSFNYDSMLEWFLELFGFQVNSITRLPALEGSEDVRIYHPHGFVPHPLHRYREGNFLILGSKDANLRAGNLVDPWWGKEKEILETGVGLYVGLSFATFRDRAFQPHLALVGDAVIKERPLGFWIFLIDLQSGETPLDEKQIEEVLNYNVVPVQVTDPTDVSEFIMKISQRALEKTFGIS